MLQPRVLPQIIQQANTNGIKSTLLLHSNGSLLSAYGENTKEMDKLVSAIVSNVWNSYSKAGRNAFVNSTMSSSSAANQNFGDENDENFVEDDDENFDDGDDENEEYGAQHGGSNLTVNNNNNNNKMVEKLQCLILDCEMGRLAIVGVSSKVILCLCAEKSVEFGMLKAKAMTVREYLAEPFALIESE